VVIRKDRKPIVTKTLHLFPKSVHSSQQGSITITFRGVITYLGLLLSLVNHCRAFIFQGIIAGQSDQVCQLSRSMDCRTMQRQGQEPPFLSTSSTHKRLLPAFESYAAASIPDNDADGTSTQDDDGAEDSETPSKRGRSIEDKSNTVSGSRRIIPPETPLGKYLPLSLKLRAQSANNDSIEDPVIVTPKRSNYIGWDDYFLGIAILSSKRSKDPKRAEGACIADAENRIVAIGYSGLPRGCPDTVFPWNDFTPTSDDGVVDDNSNNTGRPWLHTKQPYVCPAITNAILNKCSQDVAGCRLYVMDFPSSDSTKVIIQSQIQEIVILKGKEQRAGADQLGTDSVLEPDTDDILASRIMLEMAGITLRYHQPSMPSVLLDFGTATPMTTPSGPSCGCNNHTTNRENLSQETTKPNLTEEEQRAATLLLTEAGYNASAIVSNGRRHDYISWDDYFMSVSFLTAQRSKDPNTQVGACIVDPDHRIVGLGYNGMPRGLSDDDMPWARDNANPLYNKYLYVTHAEVNAILNKGSSDVRGSTLYVALFPCENCAKMIIQSGIRRVVFLNDHYHDTPGCKASRIMLQCARVELQQYTPTLQQMLIDYDR
jgi:dCMP deaminase